MKKSIFLTTLLFVWMMLVPPFEATVSAEADDGELFADFLQSIGIESNKLGFRPDGTWSRFPDPAAIPYISEAFTPLFNDPQKIYPYVDNIAVTARSFANSDYFEKQKTSIYKILYYLGVDRLVEGLRGYGFPETDISHFKNPLQDAVEQIYRVKNRTFRFFALNKVADYPRLDNQLSLATKNLHKDVKAEIALILVQIADAYSWWVKALERVDVRDVNRVFELRDLVDTQFDGMEYFPEIDRIMEAIDWHSFYYSALKLSFCIEQFTFRIRELRKRKNINWSIQEARFNTPLGKVLINGSKYDRIHVEKALLVVDFGGNDRYTGNPGGNTDFEHPFGILVDLAGNDKYNETLGLPAMGAAILGSGILIDLDGNDNYRADALAQGAAILGVGICADFAGTDSYILQVSGQGAGYFGTGLLLDYSGRDFYRIWANGQGLGGTGGIGMLLDGKGNDYYFAEADAKITGRGDYHSEGKLSYSYAQGCGVGRRGDISDGHAWAGGLGVLVDLDGVDKYNSANWSAGSAYWFGMGFLYDGNGNDIYRASVFSLASGAHFSISALIDQAGDDTYTAYDRGEMVLGFGHDYTVSLFLDQDGNDKYTLKQNGLGHAINMSQAIFVDVKGDDTYQIAARDMGMGWASKIEPPFSIYSTAWAYSNQLGLFLDGAGSDKYLLDENNRINSWDTYRDNLELNHWLKEWQQGWSLGKFFDGEINTNNWFSSYFSVSDR